MKQNLKLGRIETSTVVAVQFLERLGQTACLEEHFGKLHVRSRRGWTITPVDGIIRCHTRIGERSRRDVFTYDAMTWIHSFYARALHHLQNKYLWKNNARSIATVLHLTVLKDLATAQDCRTVDDGAGAAGRRGGAGAGIVVVIITASLADDGGQGGRGQPTKHIKTLPETMNLANQWR